MSTFSVNEKLTINKLPKAAELVGNARVRTYLAAIFPFYGVTIYIALTGRTIDEAIPLIRARANPILRAKSGK